MCTTTLHNGSRLLQEDECRPVMAKILRRLQRKQAGYLQTQLTHKGGLQGC